MNEKKPLRIAFELISLSDDALTGIGKVGLNHLSRLAGHDSVNEYYAYSIKRFTLLDAERARGAVLCEILSPIGRLKETILLTYRDARDRLDAGGHLHPFLLLKAVVVRLLKIILEAADRACIHLMLARSFKKNGIDVYIGSHADFFPAIFPRGIRKTWIIHDIVWKLYPGTMWDRSALRNYFIKRNMNRCDMLFAVSNSTKNDLRDVLGIQSKIVTVHNAADGDVFYPAGSMSIKGMKKRYGITNPYILSVCTLEPRKNVEMLLRAFGHMRRRDSFQLVLVGKQGWIHPEFFELIDDLGIRGRVVLPGYVPEEDLAPLYSGARLFAFPSLYEGFGMPVLEAMQCGCPVVTSTSSSLPEVAGDAGILVDPEDVGALTNAMERVLTDRRLHERLRRMGLARAGIFSWDKSSAVMNEAIVSLMKNGVGDHKQFFDQR